MRVIFLDIDGVLNSLTFRVSPPPPYAQVMHRFMGQLDPVAVKLMAKLAKHCDAHIVISSTWRILNSVADIKHALTVVGGCNRIIGATDNLHTTGVTSRFGHPVARGLQIQRWLDAHPEVEQFAIVDDDSDMGDLTPYLVKTCNSHGFQEHHAASIALLLACQWGQDAPNDSPKEGSRSFARAIRDALTDPEGCDADNIEFALELINESLAREMEKP